MVWTRNTDSVLHLPLFVGGSMLRPYIPVNFTSSSRQFRKTRTPFLRREAVGKKGNIKVPFPRIRTATAWPRCSTECSSICFPFSSAPCASLARRPPFFPFSSPSKSKILLRRKKVIASGQEHVFFSAKERVPPRREPPYPPPSLADEISFSPPPSRAKSLRPPNGLFFLSALVLKNRVLQQPSPFFGPAPALRGPFPRQHVLRSSTEAVCVLAQKFNSPFSPLSLQCRGRAEFPFFPMPCRCKPERQELMKYGGRRLFPICLRASALARKGKRPLSLFALLGRTRLHEFTHLRPK